MENHATLAKPAIRIGERIYSALSWKRRDYIYLNGLRIGLITLSREDRTGSTVCLLTGHTRPGRQIAWCVDEAQHAMETEQHLHAA